MDANGGHLSSHALFEMKYLDSAMKESQRTNPGSLGMWAPAMFQRTVSTNQAAQCDSCATSTSLSS